MKPQRTKLLENLRSALDSLEPNGAITPIFLGRITEELGGSWTAYWQVDEAADILRFIQDWHSPEFDSEKLEDHIVKRTFSAGEGMPGIVWRTKKAKWSRDIIKDMMLPRSLKALNAGLETGIWIPVINNTEVIGVIEILGRQNELLTNGLADTLQAFGEEVGKAIGIERQN